MMQNRRITAVEFHDWLLEAAETERRLPSANRRTPASWWPDVAAGLDWLAWPSEKTHTRLAGATAEQVDTYDLVHDIVVGLPDPADRALLWAVAQSAVFRQRGPAWAKVAKLRHCDRRAVKRDYEATLLEAVMRWNRD